MKKFVFLMMLLMGVSFLGFSQERYGNSLNLGVGVAYYGYIGHSVPAVHLDYEFDVVKNLTLAPSVSMYSYGDTYYYGGANQNYRYHALAIPIGIKSAYYFDDLLNASDLWDFYVGGSLGATIVSSYWDAGYSGNRNAFNSPPAVWVALHVGAEYHFTPRLGGFLDLSTGISTVGLAIHRKR